MSLHRRNEIAPQMADYDAVGERWLPYVMRFHCPCVRLPSVSTDQYGFRTTVLSESGQALPFEYFRLGADGVDTAVVLGSSSAFGVGASSDFHTLSSILNRKTELKWFNYGGRAFNSTQEAILFSLYLPARIKVLVIFSGVNNLTLSYLGSRTSPVFNSFYLQSAFERAMESATLGRGIGVRRSLGVLLQEVRARLWGSTGSQPGSRRNLGEQYADILECFRRDLMMLKALGNGCGFRLIFVLQPIATWIAKELAGEEQEIFQLLDRMGRDWEVLSQHIGAHRDTYLRDTRSICSEVGVPFLNMNDKCEFQARKWLFVDRVHLTDEGYSLVADAIRKEL